MSTNKNATALNAHVNQETYNLVENMVTEIGPPVTKSGIAAFIVQTFARDTFKMKRELIEFCQRREDRKNKVLAIIEDNIRKKEEKSKTDDILQSIKDMMQFIIKDNKSIKDELKKLKEDLGEEQDNGN